MRAPASERAAARHLPGEEGIWILVCGDLVVFSLLFGAFLVERSGAEALFARSQELLDSGLATFNTCVLLTSSWFIAGAVRSLKAGRRGPSVLMVHATIVCGVGFALVKMYEYHDELTFGITPNTNPFFMLYYVVTGMHLAHVATGVALLLWIARRIRDGAGDVRLLEVGATFWHFVDIVWIVIFPVVYLANQ